MPISPSDFFMNYVMSPYFAWCENELCEWKAMATASGLNALVEHVFRDANPTDPIGTRQYGQKLDAFRDGLQVNAAHQHIKYVVETYKHVELRDLKKVPNVFDAMQKQEAGAFSKEFSSEFDGARNQLGFPYRPNLSTPEEWVPLRRIVEECIGYWKGEFGML